MADHIKCGLIGGGSPRHSNFFFHVGSANIALANTTADILIDNRLRPPLDMVTVDQERELYTKLLN